MHSLPVFLRLAGRPVMLIGAGEAADAKRRLLERAGAAVVGEDGDAALAVVAVADGVESVVARLKARGILVNAVDRPALCDFTLPAIVDRDPVLIAIGTGGASAGLAAALRQRLEALLPVTLGTLATQLRHVRGALRARWPDGDARRQAIAAALGPGGALDPLTEHDAGALDRWLAKDEAAEAKAALVRIALRSLDPEDLSLREARWLARADRVYHRAGVPPVILDRARADAPRIACAAPPENPGPGLSVDIS
ncbi:precorrin-2 dehydrogenase/sirohydrochlorin ferrochelatase family protein [Sphingomonas flavalba]|uniref:precorrin-2 dehydrogenase/sirohydrochlorin ferrochelatase family protein n=1 Tax=Sphingomonas flavalba TaxID=2559804 RepID=UPI00109DD790|nr:NAD(P)-dependent oxidoreductase [Sphingomonas flavalba]